MAWWAQALYIVLLTGALAASSYDITKNAEDTLANQVTYHLTIQKADTKEQLSPILIKCGLSDIIVISAPVVNRNVTTIQLTQPNGDTRLLQLSLEKESLIPDGDENSIVINYNKEKTLLNNYKIFNINHGQSIDVWNTVSEEHVDKMKPNDFMIGPLSEDQHGNWVLSLFAEDYGKVLEMFQVITMEITEYISPKEASKTLHKGDTFHFGFAYPIPHLESCQFMAPEATFDRWYDRDQDNLASCMFVVKNVTKQDEGLWIVVAVGRIVYNTQTFLNVI